MFLQLSHTKLDVYEASRLLARECYRVTNEFPADERFSMVQQVRTAALSVHLNLAEGCSRKSKAERGHFFEVSRGSVVEIDALENLKPFGKSIVNAFKLLSGMINPRD